MLLSMHAGTRFCTLGKRPQRDAAAHVPAASASVTRWWCTPSGKFTILHPAPIRNL